MSETSTEIDTRLSNVLRKAEFEVVHGAWVFDEFSAQDFSARVNQKALALIRDGQQWSQLVPCAGDVPHSMIVWSFHFEADVNNSGFVGWLASRIKAETGSGVAVVCGQNSSRGGIFDYWCAPVRAGSSIMALLSQMREKDAR